MSTKNKILLSVGALCLVAVVAVVAIVAVYAANQQNFTSNISVTYTAKEIEGKVMANWYEGSGSANAMKVNGSSDGATSLEFKAGAADGKGALSPTKSALTLSTDCQYIVFEYIFTNTNKEYKATLSYKDDGSDDANITIYAGTSETSLNASDIRNGTEAITKQAASGNFIEDFTIPAGSTELGTNRYAYVVITIGDKGWGENATFSGTFSWVLDSTVA